MTFINQINYIPPKIQNLKGTSTFEGGSWKFSFGQY